MQNIVNLYYYNKEIYQSLDFPLNLICKTNEEYPDEKINQIYNRLKENNIIDSYHKLPKVIEIDKNMLSKINNLEKTIDEAKRNGCKFIVFNITSIKERDIKYDEYKEYYFELLVRFIKEKINSESILCSQDKSIYTIVLNNTLIDKFIRNYYKERIGKDFILGIDFYDSENYDNYYLDLNLLRDEINKVDDLLERHLKILANKVDKTRPIAKATQFDIFCRKLYDLPLNNIESVPELIAMYKSLSEEEKKLIETHSVFVELIARYNVISEKTMINNELEIVEKQKEPNNETNGDQSSKNDVIEEENIGDEEENIGDEEENIGDEEYTTVEESNEYDWHYLEAIEDYKKNYFINKEENDFSNVFDLTFPLSIINSPEPMELVKRLEKYYVSLGKNVVKYIDETNITSKKGRIEGKEIIELSKFIKQAANSKEDIYIIYLNNFNTFIEYDLNKLIKANSNVRLIILSSTNLLNDSFNVYNFKSGIYEYKNGNKTKIDLLDFLSSGKMSTSSSISNKIIDIDKIEEEINKEFSKFVGMKEIKKEVRDIILSSVSEVERVRKGGRRLSNATNNIIITGCPGTGKTNFAKVITKLLSKFGIVKSNEIYEVKTSDMIGQYVGETEKKMNVILEKIKDKVVFIDEAYRLINDPKKMDDFGKIALQMLLEPLEDPNYLFIFAGYKDRMEELNMVNDGFCSRFRHSVNIPDYSSYELYQIFISFLFAHPDIKPTDQFFEESARLIKYIHKHKDTKYGNGRAVKKIFDFVTSSCVTRTRGQSVNIKLDVTDINDFVDSNKIFNGIDMSEFEVNYENKTN